MIGLRVKEIRKKNKDTLKSLAEKIDYDWSNLSKVERGVYTASTDILEKISKVYNIDISYFFLSKEDEKLFTENERSLLYERDLSTENIKSKYAPLEQLNVSDEEIETLAKLIETIRTMAKNESS